MKFTRFHALLLSLAFGNLSASAEIIDYEFTGSITSAVCMNSCDGLPAVGEAVTGLMSLDFGAEDGINDSFGSSEWLSTSMTFPLATFGSTIEMGVGQQQLDGVPSGSTDASGKLSSLSISSFHSTHERDLSLDEAGGRLDQNLLFVGVRGTQAVFSGTWTRVTPLPVSGGMSPALRLAILTAGNSGGAPNIDYLDSTHSADNCLGAGGNVVSIGGDGNGSQVCRFDSSFCPGGWAMADMWSTTENTNQPWSQAAIDTILVTCNGVSENFLSVSSASGGLGSEFHTWSNNSLESASCRVVTPSISEVSGSCSSLQITQAVTASSQACSGAQYVSSIAFRDTGGTPYSTWLRLSSLTSSTAVRTQVGCY